MIKRKINSTEIWINENEAREIYLDDTTCTKLKAFDFQTIADYLSDTNKGYMPVSCNFEITNYCNFHCSFCYINCKNVAKHSWSFEEFRKVVDFLVEKGMLMCNLTGGEALLNKDFVQMYKYLKNKGVLVVVFSNGSLINEEIMELFREYPPYLIEMSVYGYDAKHFSNTTKINSDTCATIYENIRRLKNEGFSIRCKTPITSLTYDQVDLIHKWMQENGIDYYTSPELLDTYAGDSTKSYMAPDEYFVKKGAGSNTEGTFDYKKAFDCHAGKTSIFVSHDKFFYPCMGAYGVEELRSKIDFDEVGNSYQVLNDTIMKYKNRRLCSCRGCTKAKDCHFCIVNELKKENPECFGDINRLF